MVINVDLDDIYDEMDRYDKKEMIKYLSRDGYLVDKIDADDAPEIIDPKENMDIWETMIYKLSKVKQYSISNEDMEITNRLVKKYSLE